jgi:putative aminopeptidase FrvX
MKKPTSSKCPINTSLLKQLCAVHAPSGEERPLRDFLIAYIKKSMKQWAYKPQLIYGDEFQDCLIVKFGKPRTAIFAHMDSIGFTVRYNNQLVSIGSPDADSGTKLVGRDSYGDIECDLELDKEGHAFYRFGRTIQRGTSLTYKIDFKETKDSIQTPYLDNRLGILNALHVCENLKDGVIVFSCWEEHGGGSVSYLADYIFRKWNVRQALISDITWISDGVHPGKGVVISLRDRNVPRKVFIDTITSIADKAKVPYQLEVEAMGSSDGGELQRSHLPFDWCFVGAPELSAHSPHEKVNKFDVETMFALYDELMGKL